MATNYPSSLDTFDTIASDKKTSDTVGGRTHRDMHNDLADAVEAVQAELGTDPAGAYATVKLRLEALEAEVVVTHPSTDDVKVVAASQTVHYDSGWRDISSLLDADFALADAAGSLELRRVNHTVFLSGRLKRVTASGSQWNPADGLLVSALPTGFRGRRFEPVGLANIDNHTGMIEFSADLTQPAAVYLDGSTWAAGDIIYFAVSWVTDDTLPSSLPGTLVTAAPA